MKRIASTNCPTLSLCGLWHLVFAGHSRLMPHPYWKRHVPRYRVWIGKSGLSTLRLPSQISPGLLHCLNFSTKPAVIGVLVLVLGAGVLLWMPDSLSGLGRVESPRRPMVSEPVAVSADTSAGNVVSTPVVVPGVAQLAGVAAAPQPLADASQPTVLGRSDLSWTPDIAGSASGLVAFRARASSWVEVTDSKGVVQLQDTAVWREGGSVWRASFSVVIGRADVTEVEVRGKPFALETVAKENVARFEVK